VVREVEVVAPKFKPGAAVEVEVVAPNDGKEVPKREGVEVVEVAPAKDGVVAVDVPKVRPGAPVAPNPGVPKVNPVLVVVTAAVFAPKLMLDDPKLNAGDAVDVPKVGA